MTPPRTDGHLAPLVLLGVALAVACVASTWASGAPDGLEHVAATMGFAGSARDSIAASSPLADYAVGSVPGWVSTAVAGAVGCGLVFGAAYSVSRLASRARSDRAASLHLREDGVAPTDRPGVDG